MGQELSTCQFVSNIMIFRSFVGPQRCNLKPITYSKDFTLLIAKLTGLIGVLRKG